MCGHSVGMYGNRYTKSIRRWDETKTGFKVLFYNIYNFWAVMLLNNSKCLPVECINHLELPSKVLFCKVIKHSGID